MLLALRCCRARSRYFSFRPSWKINFHCFQSRKRRSCGRPALSATPSPEAGHTHLGPPQSQSALSWSRGHTSSVVGRVVGSSSGGAVLWQSRCASSRLPPGRLRLATPCLASTCARGTKRFASQDRAGVPACHLCQRGWASSSLHRPACIRRQDMAGKRMADKIYLPERFGRHAF